MCAVAWMMSSTLAVRLSCAAIDCSRALRARLMSRLCVSNRWQHAGEANWRYARAQRVSFRAVAATQSSCAEHKTAPTLLVPHLSNRMPLTIGYWNIRGLAAPLRMLASYAGLNDPLSPPTPVSPYDVWHRRRIRRRTIRKSSKGGRQLGAIDMVCQPQARAEAAQPPHQPTVCHRRRRGELPLILIPLLLCESRRCRW